MRIFYLNFHSVLMTLSLALILSCSSDSEPPINEKPTSTTIKTFNKTLLNFADNGSQSATETFSFITSDEKVEKITMYVRLECPSGGCGAWDVFANISIEDTSTGEWYELGRFITPYGVDNSQRPKGFEFDVTDFRSLLVGSVKLRSFIEVWTSEGWLLSVDFKIEEGDPDHRFSSLVPLFNYAQNSQQIPYGEALPDGIILHGAISLPSNVELAKLRSVISGWGHATPNDSDGRGCAEWCFRTHTFNFGNKTYIHSMDPIGCESNSVSPQNGNWAPDRAGWCPGKEVPVRFDNVDLSNAGKTVSFEYRFEDWKNNEGNGKAYYSLSSFIILESSTPIEKPIVR